EVVHAAEPAAGLHREPDVLVATAPAVSTGRLDEKVTHQGTERAAGIGGDRGADPMVVHPGGQGNVVAVVTHTAVLVTAGPVVVEQVAVAQILDASAVPVDQRHERPCCWRYAKRPSREPGGPGKRRAQMRGTQVEHVADQCP